MVEALAAGGRQAGQAVFQHLFRLETFHLQVPAGCIHQGSLRDQPDQFTVVDRYTVSSRLTPDHFYHPAQRRFPKIGQVHRNLGQPVHLYPNGFDVAQPSGRIADRPGHLFSDADVVCAQIHVEGNQGLARPDDDCPRRTQQARPKIGYALGVAADLFFQGFVFAAADILQILALRAGGGFFVQIYRQVQFGAYPFAQPPGQFHAF